MQPTFQKKKRDKPILSCSFCRGRKLRCDRKSPCGACVRRGRSAECFYTSSEQERRDAIDYRPRARGQQARHRITRLETLVTEMRDMAQRSMLPLDNEASSSIPAEIEQKPAPTGNPGKLSLGADHAVYIGSSHWATILEDMQCLKEEISDRYSDGTRSRESTPSEDAEEMSGSPATRICLINSAARLTKEEILTRVPSRKIVDRLVSQFFNAFDFASVIVHRHKFLNEYESFWQAPAACPIMWVGLLFSIMTMSAFLQQQDLKAMGLSIDESQETLETYRELTIHCLIVGDYLQPKRYTIETLTLHFAVDQNLNFDTYIGNWILIGVVIRIAIRVGLHRDPSHWPDIRPLHAELRRRLWLSLYQMDFFTSTQVGLPRIIKDSQCDTHLPAHLLDDDIRMDHVELPPERPATESSQLLHLIQRQSIIKVAAEIYDVTEAASLSPSIITALGAKLDRAIEGIPDFSKHNPLEASVTDSPSTILHRMFLDILIHKAVYLLHRRSFTKGPPGKESIQSNEKCIDAALSILKHQQRMNEETEPGCLMFTIRWKVASSLNHEFLQATMMLCFALRKLHGGELSLEESCAARRRDEMLGALAVAKSLWEKHIDQSVEARRAVGAIRSVLKQDQVTASPSLTISDGSFERTPGGNAQDYAGGFNMGRDTECDSSYYNIDGGGSFVFGGNMDEFVMDAEDLVWPDDFDLMPQA